MNDTPVGSVASSRHETRFALPERTLTTPRSRDSICRPLTVDGGVVVGAEAEALGVTLAVALGVAEAVGAVEVAAAPVQVTPLSANVVGAGFDPVHAPLNPKAAVPPAARLGL